LHWHHHDRWLQFLHGKSITGGLLGGYAGVEIAKRLLGYRAPTGDMFALIAPLAIMLGRVGCILHGCCLGQPCEATWFTVNGTYGIPRWPAAHVELLFNALMLLVILLWRSRGLWPAQHFHLYLIAYGLFRFVHEFARATPRIVGPLSGYHFAALAITILGTAGFILRQQYRVQSSIPIGQAPASETIQLSGETHAGSVK
jgi:phosphatidylglycerol:prolipoprotein diacylglycerol transferase